MKYEIFYGLLILLVFLGSSVSLLIWHSEAFDQQQNINSSPLVTNPELLLNPLEPNYLVGEPIQYSGLINIPESKSLYVVFNRNIGTQRTLPDGLKIGYSEDIPIIKSDIAGYNGFSGKINTTNFLPGNYSLLVILLDEQGREIIVRNQTDTILTESLINNPERQSGNPVLVTLFFAITAICLVSLGRKSI
jgi:hypothetical protein